MKFRSPDKEEGAADEMATLKQRLSDAERELTKTQRRAKKEEDEKGEISAASEATMHALLEEVRAMRTELASLGTRIFEPSVNPETGKKELGLFGFLFDK